MSQTKDKLNKNNEQWQQWLKRLLAASYSVQQSTKRRNAWESKSCSVSAVTKYILLSSFPQTVPSVPFHSGTSNRLVIVCKQCLSDLRSGAVLEQKQRAQTILQQGLISGRAVPQPHRLWRHLHAIAISIFQGSSYVVQKVHHVKILRQQHVDEASSFPRSKIQH